MKIAIAQLNYRVGDFAANTKKIIDSIQNAKNRQADLIIFAEMAIGGYAAKDLLRNQVFLDDCERTLTEIATQCQGIACIIGTPVRNKGEGKALFNAALVIEDGEITHSVKKRLLPDYDIFDEYRYFEPSPGSSCVKIGDTKVALTICEDLWDDDKENSYVGDVMQDLSNEHPDLVINIAASPFSYTHFDARKNIFMRNALRAGTPLIYVNQVGAHTDIIFDGRSFVMDHNGKLIAELQAFGEDVQYFSFEGNNIVAELNAPAPHFSEIQLIHDALILGLRDYFQKSGFQKAVLGLSGGLDSAIVAALACEALGSENVLAILLPSKYSSEHSVQDALDLVKNTGCHHYIIPIESMATAFEQELLPVFSGLRPDVTEENIQARIRAVVLMAISNKFGHILLNTSNKSEAAVGYGTLYGDMSGALSVIGDVYKTQAYELARYINREREIIPTNTIVKPPSAELRPGQMDSDSLPPYDVLDSILYHLVENEKSGSEVVKLGFDEALVNRVSKLLNAAEFKRFQAPPILRVSPKAFGAGRSMPLVAKYPF